MVKKIEKLIKSTVILSDDGLYRYQLSRVWDENKPKATVVMLNPSKADMLITDRTVMNVTNFLVENHYGSITIVNLFAYRATKPNFLNQRDKVHESFNNNYLKEAFFDSDVIIVAWVRDRDKYVTRKREVENLLLEYKGKIKCFEDGSGKKLRHPRDLGSKWNLVDYEFMFV
ncbi:MULTISPECIES: DUF1643 domain-containing protein [unclassified Bacillus (in: firmicutes)]|uniref:DUF1643 domain-containing protein n=1 Tax=unclassified Bacillus (in: firmicutes) TaxID=185979 RepID=UPI001BE650C2|nr:MULTISPECIES: DUF1643 domain-containing protein [unclassified Bacillus (in: firmicutes)]MBT2616123.1 DUF1643 domain-containing protein [Bacillus sp. ISL-78]MBT2628427.1 DUF1643 domain-containing protein [Bacillus sp. ISL-101]